MCSLTLMTLSNPNYLLKFSAQITVNFTLGVKVQYKDMGKGYNIPPRIYETLRMHLFKDIVLSWICILKIFIVSGTSEYDLVWK